MRLTALLLLLLVVAVPLRAEEEEPLTFRTFDVSLLTARRAPSFGSPLGALPSSSLRLKVTPEERGASPFIEEAALVEAVRDLVAPASWDEDGTSLSCRAGRLFARNRGKVLAELARFLGELESEASRRVLFHVDVYSLPGDRYAGGATTPAGGEILASGSVEAYPGVRVSLEVTRRDHIVTDYEVEIASKSAIAMPVIEAVREGLVVDLVAHPTLDGHRILVECLLEHGEFVRPHRGVKLTEDPAHHLGLIELPHLRHSGALATAVVAPVDSVMIPFARNGRTFVVRVVARLLGGDGSP
ncbi:MAG: hypothetical protein ACYS99_22290, partial [Planctomycetota bacterium]